MGLAAYGDNKYHPEFLKYVNYDSHSMRILFNNKRFFRFIEEIFYKNQKQEKQFLMRARLAYAAQVILEKSVEFLLICLKKKQMINI